jgi:5-methylcytosine-specific restriction endonuclease McrA
MKIQVLMLNKSFIPIKVINIKKAICLLYNNKAKVLEAESYNVYEWEDWTKLYLEKYKKIKTSSFELCVPEIIILKNYDKVERKRIMPNKKNIYKRDKGLCQYCGKFLSSQESTIDHINPKSKNGKFTWDNCVISCVKCNLKKSNYDLKEVGMKLMKKPETPNFEKINFCFLNSEVPKSWHLFN